MAVRTSPKARRARRRVDFAVCLRRAGRRPRRCGSAWRSTAGARNYRDVARLACESLTHGGDPSMQKRACRPAGHGEHARLSAVAGGLLRRRDGVGRRGEPPRYESGFRAHGSNQRFHRLLRHAVARALTTAPSLAGVSPAALRFSPLRGGGASAARDAVAQTTQKPGASIGGRDHTCRWFSSMLIIGRASRNRAPDRESLPPSLEQ